MKINIYPIVSSLHQKDRINNETKEFLKMGIDTILTNDYNLISQIVK